MRAALTALDKRWPDRRRSGCIRAGLAGLRSGGVASCVDNRCGLGRGSTAELRRSAALCTLGGAATTNPSLGADQARNSQVRRGSGPSQPTCSGNPLLELVSSHHEEVLFSTQHTESAYIFIVEGSLAQHLALVCHRGLFGVMKTLGLFSHDPGPMNRLMQRVHLAPSGLLPGFCHPPTAADRPFSGHARPSETPARLASSR